MSAMPELAYHISTIRNIYRESKRNLSNFEWVLAYICVCYTYITPVSAGLSIMYKM